MNERAKWLVALAAVCVLGAALAVPAVAHYPTDKAGHDWKEHLKPLATKTFYTKGQSNGRFLASSTLPAGKTMIGDWGVIEDGNAAAWHVESYAQRLPANVVANYILPNGVSALGTQSNCPGSLTNPKARAGHLCVYEGSHNGNFADPSARVCFFRGPQTTDACQVTTDRYGFGLAIFPADPGAQFFGQGTWAVTARRTTPSTTASRSTLGTLSRN